MAVNEEKLKKDNHTESAIPARYQLESLSVLERGGEGSVNHPKNADILGALEHQTGHADENTPEHGHVVASTTPDAVGNFERNFRAVKKRAVESPYNTISAMLNEHIPDNRDASGAHRITEALSSINEHK